MSSRQSSLATNILVKQSVNSETKTANLLCNTENFICKLQESISCSVQLNGITYEKYYNFYKMTNKMQLCRILYSSLTALHVLSDIFAHHQEHPNCNYSFWFYSRSAVVGCCHDSSRQRRTWIKPEAVITVKMFLMMSENIAQNMYSSQGTINYPKQLHFVGHFVKIVSLCTDPWMSNKTS